MQSAQIVPGAVVRIASSEWHARTGLPKNGLSKEPVAPFVHVEQFR